MGSIFSPQGIPSSPTSQQISSGSIQPWAAPYVFNYLNNAQNLVNNAQPTQFQQQVWSSAQNQQTPSQFGQGANLAQQGGQGMLGTTGTALGYGAMGAGYGGQAAGAGQNYYNMATNPAATAAFMNPYIQQSLAPQLQLLNQQEQLAQQQAQGQATAQGAFGGNRAALNQGLIGQNYALAQQNAIGQGYNTAFQQAQQAQQYGAGLGLQGLQAAMQGAGLGLQGVNAAQQGYQGATQAGAALGNIGSQQGQYGLGLLGLQNQLANQQYNLPFQNQQYMQGMLSGLPIATTTTQGYQAAPNVISQLAGLGTAGLGGYALYNALSGGASGGLPKDFKKVKGFDQGGVASIPTEEQSDNALVIPNDLQSLYLKYLDRLENENSEVGYAKGGKVGSDLADIQLHRLVG